MTNDLNFEKAFYSVCKHYGQSKYQKTYPYLQIEDSVYCDTTSSFNLMGEYCNINNTLTVYWQNIDSTENLIKTLIHEYQHYLQSPSWMTRYYNMGYNYYNHPYEIAAYKEEENWKVLLSSINM